MRKYTSTLVCDVCRKSVYAEGKTPDTYNSVGDDWFPVTIGHHNRYRNNGEQQAKPVNIDACPECAVDLKIKIFEVLGISCFEGE